MTTYYHRIYPSRAVQDLLYKLEAVYGCPPIYKNNSVTIVEDKILGRILIATYIGLDLHAVRIKKGVLTRV